MSCVNFDPIQVYLSYLQKCVNFLKDLVRKPYFLHIEFIQNLSSKTKQEIYNQLSTLQTRIPDTLLEFIFSYLNDDPILLEVCKSWNNGMKKILQKKHLFFIRRFETGCKGLKIAGYNDKLFVGSKNEICVFSNEGKKITTFFLSVPEKINNLKIYSENKKIYLKL